MPLVKLLCLISPLAVATTSLCAQTAVLEYSFNQTGTTSASTGSNTTALRLFASNGTSATDYHGAAGTGVSGAASDRALDFTSATGMGSGSSGPIANHAADLDAIDGMRSLTLQGWFKTDSTTPLSGAARLFSNQGDGHGFFLLANGTGNLALQVGNGSMTTFTSTNGAYGATQLWVFFAVTVDTTITSNNVRFYVGGTSTGVSLVNTFSWNSGLGITNDAASLLVGSETAGFQRPFDGWLDNFRVFGGKANASDASGALTLGQLETIRAMDAAIPEPSTYAVLAGAGVLGLSLVRRRR